VLSMSISVLLSLLLLVSPAFLNPPCAVNADNGRLLLLLASPAIFNPLELSITVDDVSSSLRASIPHVLSMLTMGGCCSG
jgi:hypothetical protein